MSARLTQPTGACRAPARGVQEPRRARPGPVLRGRSGAAAFPTPRLRTVPAQPSAPLLKMSHGPAPHLGRAHQVWRRRAARHRRRCPSTPCLVCPAEIWSGAMRPSPAWSVGCAGTVRSRWVETAAVPDRPRISGPGRARLGCDTKRAGARQAPVGWVNLADIRLGGPPRVAEAAARRARRPGRRALIAAAPADLDVLRARHRGGGGGGRSIPLPRRRGARRCARRARRLLLAAPGQCPLPERPSCGGMRPWGYRERDA